MRQRRERLLATYSQSLGGGRIDHHGCFSCELWELKFLIALRAGGAISHHIGQPELRANVVEHITVNWCRCVESGEPPEFDDFLDGYCASVELDVDPRATGTKRRDWEHHRVWTNHAALLRGELDMVHSRPVRQSHDD
jgi:hypothetical protein